MTTAPPWAQQKEATWLAMRKVSLGADVTLVSGAFAFTASFKCAEKLAPLVGRLGTYADLGDGIEWNMPTLEIPLASMVGALKAITEQFSVALVDVMPSTERMRAGFVTFCLVPRRIVHQVSVKESFESLMD